MANDLNKCMFIGRLGRDPETNYLPSGSAVTSFSIAVGESWKDKNTGDKQERTEWINITAFGKLAEICSEYLKKGQQVFISGKFKTDKYEKDGVTKYSTKIIANEMQMLGGRSQQPGDSSAPAASSSQASHHGGPPVSDGPAGGSADFDDDIPF